MCRWRRQGRWLVEVVVGVSGCSSLCESAGGDGSVDGWERLLVEFRVVAVFWNVQVEAARQMAGSGFFWRCESLLCVRICRWRRQCRCLVEAFSGVSGCSSLLECAGGGGRADGW